MVQVGIIMGSNSDWNVMQHAAAFLQQFGVAFECKVVSAHRTPDLMFEYAEQARGRGLKAIIAGAGGAAHLPGMVAAKTTCLYWAYLYQANTCAAKTLCCQSCKCPKAYLWPLLRLVKQALPTPPCSPFHCLPMKMPNWQHN